MNSIKNILVIGLILTLTSCDGFLDEVSQDKLVPSKVDHYAALLLQEFNSEYPLFKSVHHMTDDVIENDTKSTTAKEGYKTTYTWQREIELDENGDEITSINVAWKNSYEDIAIANYVIELIDDAKGEEEEKHYVKGEAYFVRALSYFNLLNLYGVPFVAETADTDLGVPLRTDIGVEEVYYRNTVAECYEQIEHDLEKALTLIEESEVEKTKWHPNTKAIKILLSRVYLYQEKYQEVIDLTTELLDGTYLPPMSTSDAFVSDDNDEILFSFHTINLIFSDLSDYNYEVNPDLYNLYSDKDKRKTVFFYENQTTTGKDYLTMKWQRSSYTTLGFGNIRLAEAYLNRSEAYVMSGDAGLAIADIQTLHASRYSDVSEVVYPSGTDEVVAFVFEERRKEFCFEDHHRWFDLRRMDNRPEIEHRFTLTSTDGVNSGVEVYTLLSNDANYTLPIPLDERENNPYIRNN